MGFYKLCTDLSVTEVSLKIRGGVLPTEASLRHSRVLCMNGWFCESECNGFWWASFRFGSPNAQWSYWVNAEDFTSKKKCTLCNSFIIVALLTYNSWSYIKEIGIWSIQHEKEEILQSSLSRSFSLKFILYQNSLGESNWCFSISLWCFCSSENSY